MKILIVLSCALALTQAGYASYYYPHHAPLLAPNGAPIDTPEVQLAKAEHFAAHAQARYGAAPLAHYQHANALPVDTPEVQLAKAQHYHDYAIAAQRNAVPNAVHAPWVQVASHPIDTPEVQLAKAQHHHDYAVAAQRNLVPVQVHAPWVQLASHPIDTPEVQLAKAAHFAAHAEAAGRSAHGHYRKRRSAALYPLHYPVLDHNGVPVEPAEVQAARANHLAEHARVASRSDQHYVEPAAYNSGLAYSQPHYVQAPVYYRGPGGPPAQIGHDGQPIETHEVQAAKAAHFAAHAAVRSGQYGHLGHY